MTDAHGFPEYQVLTDFEDVIIVLGGVVAVARLLERSASGVCNWRNNGARFPAAFFPLIQSALQEKKFLASKKLFTFITRQPEGDTPPIVDVA
jgi:hypothetical protein